MNKIKQFFTRKRCKKLLNNKGFSLLEVLVAVSIIGIISAIAIPQFKNYKDNAARVASDTSASNIVKALQNCLVLNDFGSCDTLGKISISCPGDATCTVGKGGTNFCAEISKGTANNEFKVCVSMDTSNGSTFRTYGGALIGKTKICGITQTGCTASGDDGKEKPASPLKTCQSATNDCASASTTNMDTGCSASPTKLCKQFATNGDCGASTGLCT